MPKSTIDIKVLPEKFEELIALAAAGTEVIVTVNDVARAKLVALPTPSDKPRILGLGVGKGSVIMSEDFDAPLPDEFWLGEQ